MLKKILFTGLFGIALQCLSFAQSFDYVFTQRVEPYENLVQSIPISEQVFWYGEAWTIPIGFDFKFFNYNFDEVLVYCASTLYFDYEEHPDSLFFAGFSQAITDRGFEGDPDGYSLSPISYQVSGTSPDRICKIEFKNAGFDKASLDDFVNLQIWLYENNNTIEVHLGPHQINDPLAYESVEVGGPIIGFINFLDDKLAVLHDSTQSLVLSYPSESFTGLIGDWPDGQVYKFTPQSVAVAEQEIPSIKIINQSNSRTLLLKNSENARHYQIFDAVGDLRMEGNMESQQDQVIISYASMNAGWYVLSIQGQDGKVSAFPFVALGQ